MNTSPLLIQEHPLQVLPSLAVRIGLEEAIVLQQVHYWITVQTKSRNEYVFKDGRYWVYNTIEEWQAKEFSWWSVPTVRRILQNLEAMGFLETHCFDKGKRHNRKWYTINYLALNELLNVSESAWQQRTDNRVKLIQSFITRSNRSSNETTRSNRSGTTRSNRSGTTRSNRSEPLYIQKDHSSETTSSKTTVKTPLTPQQGECTNTPSSSEILAPEPEPSSSGTQPSTTEHSTDLHAENKNLESDKSSGNCTTNATKNTTTQNYESLRHVYNEYKPGAWATCQKLGSRRIKALEKLHKEHGDDLTQMFIHALSFATNNHWWSTKDFGINTLLKDDKVLELAERYRNTKGDKDAQKKAQVQSTLDAIADLGGTSDD